MRRARILAVTATAVLLAGTATAAAQGGGSAQGGDVKDVPAAEGVTPLAAHNQYTGTPTSLAPGASGSAWAFCPSGEVPTGGGAGTSAFDIYLLDTRPSGNSWLVFGKNTGSTTQSITAYVICTVP
ncbi:hypothetical protein E1265_20515 [Streptomyces sp. 8K308]|uniref:hypothetical protein n=1 Tax=Streptomyces sp. 8K308 TaxID=2530388 RepID=UPI001047FB5D|nr:hypothetical protein [Streptomyces sp. 8K308]TDC20770.1 hypothetical protein E1265_20515 [Streptomyces sp. 8K308]